LKNKKRFFYFALLILIFFVFYWICLVSIEKKLSLDASVISRNLELIAINNRDMEGVLSAAELDIRLGLIKNDLSQVSKLPELKFGTGASQLNQLVSQSAKTVSEASNEARKLSWVTDEAFLVNNYAEAVLSIFSRLPKLYKAFDEYEAIRSAQAVSNTSRSDYATNKDYYDKIDRETYNLQLKALLDAKMILNDIGRDLKKIRELTYQMRWIPPSDRLDINYLNYF